MVELGGLMMTGAGECEGWEVVVGGGRCSLWKRRKGGAGVSLAAGGFDGNGSYPLEREPAFPSSTLGKAFFW